MKAAYTGHVYFLDEYSGTDPEQTKDNRQLLFFMHRVGDKYPGNTASPFDGTNCQEVIRALIERCKHLYKQIPCAETENIIVHLRSALWEFERRAARMHNIPFEYPENVPIEEVPACRTCGHIVCNHTKK